MAKSKDTAGLKLVTAEAQDVEKQFRALYERTNKTSGVAAKDAEALRKLLRENEAAELWRRIPGPLAAAESHALEQSAVTTPGVRESWRVRLDNIRKELAGENPSQAESLLAQHAALCAFRLAEAEIRYTSYLSNEHTLTVGMYYERRLTLAQRRFTRACETLERVRVMRRRAQDMGAAEESRRRA